MTDRFNNFLLLLAGPTAAGKSEIALALAEQFNGEIVSVDSMQVYRGLDIGTAKPSPEDRRRVPHHLIDVADLADSFNAASFVRLANRAVDEIRARGHLPILCGGTGLYFKALLEGLGESPPADPALRSRLEAASMSELLRELELNDPETFARIDRRNPRRVVRAVEVFRLTGKPFSALRADWATPAHDARQGREEESESPDTGSRITDHVSHVPLVGVTQVCLVRDPDDLRGRIDARVDAMFRRGLVEETRELLEQGLAGNRTAKQALGYRQVIELLRGERSLPETVELVKAKTRQFAKRQMTWFRRQMDLERMTLGPDESVSAAVGRLSTLIAARATRR